MRSQRSAFALAGFREGVRRDDEILADYVDELAALYELPREDVERQFLRFLDIYHYGSGDGTLEEWGRIHGADLEHSFIRISKPFRFRGQNAITQVLCAIERYLATGRRPARVLDFGGGFGNDTIAYMRAGHAAEYSDLLSLKNSEIVARRFEVRGLRIPIHDSLQLPDEPFDAIAAIDVLEHIYDVEETVAQLAGRLPQGGLLCCINAFGAITHDGDHLDKNRVYMDVFPVMMRAAGFRQVVDAPPFEAWRREDLVRAESVQREIDRLRGVLYAATSEHCERRLCELIATLACDPHFSVEDLPGEAAVRRDPQAGAPLSSLKERGRAAVMRFGSRHAPPAVRMAAARRATEANLKSLVTPPTGGKTLAAVADYTAVLRIATQRFASRSE